MTWWSRASLRLGLAPAFAGFRECIDKRFAVLADLKAALPMRDMRSEMLALMLPTLRKAIGADIVPQVVVVAQMKLAGRLMVTFTVAVSMGTGPSVKLFPGSISTHLQAYLVSLDEVWKENK